MDTEIFNDLFVLELANNHWGSIERGKNIVKQFSSIVRKHSVKAAIKLQFRDIDSFIHRNFIKDGIDDDLTELPKRTRYIQKTNRTKLSYNEFYQLVEFIRSRNCLPMATPFDEKSVDWCVDMNLPLIKVASSDINDWILLNKIASTKKPVIISTGGANEKQIDDVVIFFEHRNIPLAINHCVSKYPSEDAELQLNQIDYLKQRYPNHTIGLSTHEYGDWYSSMLISYGKGARTWERHIDIPYGPNDEQKEVTKYCSLPEQIDQWFYAYHKAIEMCGGSHIQRRNIDDKETKYLTSLYRGLYLNKDVYAGNNINLSDLYAAIPFQPEINQLSSRTFIETNSIAKRDLKKDQPLTIDDIA
jgi:N-acetylneuraminate synthase